MSSFFILFLLTLFSLSLSQQSVPISSRLDGYSLGSPFSPIHFSCWIDLMCSDSQAAWPFIKEMIQYYNTTGKINNNMYFTVHFLPLPYHYNAYYTAQSIPILNLMYPGNTDMIYKWIDTVFQYQSNFYNEATADMTSTEIIASFAALASKYLDINSEKFINNYTWETDSAARTSFKYGISRGVAGTPTFFINEVQVVQDNNTPWNLTQWRNIIDPLLNNN